MNEQNVVEVVHARDEYEVRLPNGIFKNDRTLSMRFIKMLQDDDRVEVDFIELPLDGLFGGEPTPFIVKFATGWGEWYVTSFLVDAVEDFVMNVVSPAPKKYIHECAQQTWDGKETEFWIGETLNE